MTALAEKYKTTVDEAMVRLIGRAQDSRCLKTEDLQGRISLTLEKYLLRDSATPSNIDVKEFIDTLNADDLCLIIACERNDASAWEQLVSKYDATVKSAARKYASSAEDAEDLASSIWAELYGLKEKDGKVKGKLSYYSGRGSLAGWLRAVVSQLAIDEFRKQSKFVQIEEAREFENLANESAESDDNSLITHSDNPEEVLARSETQKDLKDAFRQAVAKLEAEDRLILKLYYFDDLKLKDIGQTMGFHEATASRKLVRLQAELRKSVEKILAEKHGWQENEVKLHLAETASKLDISLEKMFGLLLIIVFVQEFLR